MMRPEEDTELNRIVQKRFGLGLAAAVKNKTKSTISMQCAIGETLENIAVFGSEWSWFAPVLSPGSTFGHPIVGEQFKSAADEIR
jgi:hypothetical protein